MSSWGEGAEPSDRAIARAHQLFDSKGCPVHGCPDRPAAGGRYPDGLCIEHAADWCHAYPSLGVRPPPDNDQRVLDAWLAGYAVPLDRRL